MIHSVHGRDRFLARLLCDGAEASAAGRKRPAAPFPSAALLWHSGRNIRQEAQPCAPYSS
ncbi:hypothetical protein HMPREF9946_01443 [Acetobacteraceae bacterium AT-5844]|nr:hypothetical protein HMPREF9946_01443 [Acetobacteraceae bacterium AT-5844]